MKKILRNVFLVCGIVFLIAFFFCLGYYLINTGESKVTTSRIIQDTDGPEMQKIKKMVQSTVMGSEQEVKNATPIELILQLQYFFPKEVLEEAVKRLTTVTGGV
jgi:hypothetical protein